MLEVRIYSAKHPRIDDMPKGGKPVDMADLIVKLVELRDRYASKLMEVMEKHEEILNKVDELPLVERTVIKLRYIKGLTVKQTAEETRYSERQIIRIQRRAISKLMRS